MSTQTEVLKNAVKSKTFLDALKQRLEQVRVKNHLRYVEKSLRAVNVSHLSPELQAKRAENLDNLREYWQAGNFPKNIDFRFSFVPYFRDADGTLCAMAHLIDKSGQGNLVEAVAANNNFVYVENLTDGPVLEWIDANGLTQAEAALVQPTYGWRNMPPEPLFIISAIEALLWIVALAGLVAVEWAVYKLLPISVQQRIGILASKQAMVTAILFNVAMAFVLLLIVSKSARDYVAYQLAYNDPFSFFWFSGILFIVFIFVNYIVASWLVSTWGKRLVLCLYLSIITVPVCYALGILAVMVSEHIIYKYDYDNDYGFYPNSNWTDEDVSDNDFYPSYQQPAFVNNESLHPLYELFAAQIGTTYYEDISLVYSRQDGAVEYYETILGSSKPPRLYEYDTQEQIFTSTDIVINYASGESYSPSGRYLIKVPTYENPHSGASVIDLETMEETYPFIVEENESLISEKCTYMDYGYLMEWLGDTRIEYGISSRDEASDIQSCSIEIIDYREVDLM